jgi:hypothetical protein
MAFTEIQIEVPSATHPLRMFNWALAVSYWQRFGDSYFFRPRIEPQNPIIKT